MRPPTKISIPHYETVEDIFPGLAPPIEPIAIEVVVTEAPPSPIPGPKPVESAREAPRESWLSAHKTGVRFTAAGLGTVAAVGLTVYLIHMLAVAIMGALPEVTAITAVTGIGGWVAFKRFDTVADIAAAFVAPTAVKASRATVKAFVTAPGAPTAAPGKRERFTTERQRRAMKAAALAGGSAGVGEASLLHHPLTQKWLKRMRDPKSRQSFSAWKAMEDDGCESMCAIGYLLDSDDPEGWFKGVRTHRSSRKIDKMYGKKLLGDVVDMNDARGWSNRRAKSLRQIADHVERSLGGDPKR